MTTSRPAVMGVDVGTSSTKGVLVAADGSILATAVREHAVDRPGPGQVEMDAEVWWREFVSITGQLTRGAGVEVVGIGVSGMGPCALLADERGYPVRPAILYGVDTRAQDQIDALTARLGAEEIFSRCGSALSSQAAGPKILWVSENEPEAMDRARMVLTTSSFLVHRLTGQYVLDHATAGQFTPLYGMEELDWIPEWADVTAPGISLPRLLWADEIAGQVSAEAAALLPGISTGVPVIAGSIDAWAEAVSIDACSAGDVMLMYGTTTFLIAATARPLPSRELWATPGMREGTFALSGGMAASGAITSWMRHLLGGADVGSLIEEAGLSGVGARGLLMLPYFAGERSPIHDPDARGVVAGLTLSHTRGDLYRAALEAAAFGVRHHLESMREAGCEIERILAVGGGTATALWPQIVSDVTGLPQQLPRHTVGASYGTSMLAAHRILGVDTSGWNPVIGEVLPDPAAAARYEELYELYRDLYPATAGITHALARIQREG